MTDTSDELREAAKAIVTYFNTRVDIPFREDDPAFDEVGKIIAYALRRDREETRRRVETWVEHAIGKKSRDTLGEKCPDCDGKGVLSSGKAHQVTNYPCQKCNGTGRREDLGEMLERLAEKYPKICVLRYGPDNEIAPEGTWGVLADAEVQWSLDNDISEGDTLKQAVEKALEELEK